MNPSGLTPKPSDGSWFSAWDLIPLLGLCALLGATNLVWHRLPDPLPTHFGPGGHPDGWTPKVALPWLMFGLPAGIWLLIGILGKATAPKDAPRRELQAHIIAPVRAFLTLGMFLLMALPVLVALFGVHVFAPVIASFFILLASGTALTVRRGYVHAPPEIRRHWKWGLFYINAEDPRLWVPKLSGVGWTLNFARRGAWVVMGLLLLLPLVPLALVLVTRR